MNGDKMIKQCFIAEGTMCESCEKIIVKQAKKVEGVIKASFDYETETGEVTFDSSKTDIDKILYKIEEKGYECFILEENKTDKQNKTASTTLNKLKNPTAITIAIAGLLLIAYFLLNLNNITIPRIEQNMGYGLLFIVGLLTGFHCVSMCGGFVVSYTAKAAQAGKTHHNSHIMYGAGKLVSYTIIGAAFGLLGSIITFTPMMRGIAGILAGSFLTIFGLKMLNIFPALRKFSIRTPMFLMKLMGVETRKHSSPLFIGLLNGLMIACGPLQAIYIMAAGTGSAIEGAKLLFIFGLGTLPVMLGFGYIAGHISNKATHKILKASGAIVILLGLIMLNRGLELTGSGYDLRSISTTLGVAGIVGNAATGSLNTPFTDKNGFQTINMEVDRYGWTPDKFVLKKGIPVKWVINVKELTGCNNAIQVPKYNLEFDLKEGKQVIEFTPTEEGIVSWSCWMGMIPGTFIVKEDIDMNDAKAVKSAQQEIDKAPAQPKGSCDGNCGSPTCGGGSDGCGCGG